MRSPLYRGPDGIPGLLAHRLSLTAEQKQKIRTIIEDARSKTLARIKEVLTDEQLKQLKQLEQRQGKTRPFGQKMRERGFRDGFANPRGPRPQEGAGLGDAIPPQDRRGSAQMTPRGSVRPGQPFRDGQRRGPDSPSGTDRRQPNTQGQPPANPAPGPERSWNRRSLPLEQIFEQADANKDGVVTKEEIRAFRDAGAGHPPVQPQ